MSDAPGAAADGSLTAAPASAPARFLRGLEHALLIGALAAATLLPLADTVGRPFGLHVPAGADYLQQFTLWLAFLGGLIATREARHLTFSTAELLPERVQRYGHVFAAALSAATVGVLTYASVGVVLANREQGKLLAGGLPVWLVECVMPAALALMALRFSWRAAPGWSGRTLALVAIPAAFALGLLHDPSALPAAAFLALVLAGVVLGAPVFVGMAAVSLFFFFREGIPVSAVSAEVYRLISSPTLPAIPLLTGCGYVLAESGASTRLLRFFRSLLGWMPGGLAVIVTLVLALFTTFTGGSGVTIIAVGGLVYPMLRADGYPEGFSLGLVTASGSLGLLFPPSLPVILYSVVAGTREHNVPADAMYLGGLLPGALMILMVVAYAVRTGVRLGIPRHPFAAREVASAAWSARYELALPFLVVGLFGSGRASMVETAAAALAYVAVVECFLTRDLDLRHGLPQALVKSSVLTGAVLILLSSAMGITSYIVDAQVPETLVAWVKAHIHSPVAFLLALNAVLLVIGSLVEIYAAIVALAPLVVPVAAAFGVDPIHQGIIFLANLEAGFLCPPFGLNLFLSSSRFREPLTRVTRNTFPFLLIIAAAVLLITYVPGLSLWLPRALGRR